MYVVAYKHPLHEHLWIAEEHCLKIFQDHAKTYRDQMEVQPRPPGLYNDNEGSVLILHIKEDPGMALSNRRERELPVHSLCSPLFLRYTLGTDCAYYFLC